MGKEKKSDREKSDRKKSDRKDANTLETATAPSDVNNNANVRYSDQVRSDNAHSPLARRMTMRPPRDWRSPVVIISMYNSILFRSHRFVIKIMLIKLIFRIFFY